MSCYASRTTIEPATFPTYRSPTVISTVPRQMLFLFIIVPLNVTTSSCADTGLLNSADTLTSRGFPRSPLCHPHTAISWPAASIKRLPGKIGSPGKWSGKTQSFLESRRSAMIVPLLISVMVVSCSISPIGRNVRARSCRVYSGTILISLADLNCG